MISESKGLVFIHIPKTAGNAIQTVLKRYSDDELTTVADFQDGIERFEVRSKSHSGLHKHSKISDYRQAIGSERLSRMAVFTCVRNPWDRAISFYFSPHRGVTHWDRAEFVRLVRKLPTMLSYLTYRQTIKRRIWHPDHIVRFENLFRDFKKLCCIYQISPVELPIRNRARKQNYLTYYDDELVNLVGERFKEDVDYFGYSFEQD